MGLDESDRTERLSLKPVIACAIVCGVMTVLAVGASTFAYFNSPGVHTVTSYVNSNGQRTESKELYLFVLPFFQALIFLIPVCAILRWDTLAGKSVERLRYYQAHMNLFRSLELPFLFKVTAFGFCIIAGVNLLVSLYRVTTLMR